MTLAESRRRKLKILRRSLAARRIKEAAQLLRRLPSGHAPAASPAEAAPMALAEGVPGEEVRGPAGAYWLSRRSLDQLSPADVSAQKDLLAVLRGARQRFDELEASPALCHVADGPPEGPLFLHIESAATEEGGIFLIGLMACRHDQLVFDQLLARHCGEEPAILDAFAQRLRRARTLVSFSARASDMTRIRKRAAFHGLELPPAPPHLDIRRESRRRWRGQLPNFRLRTLEHYLCRRHRTGQIPQAQIPQAYRSFVATGEARGIQAVTHHNLLDLLTMGQLVCRLLTNEQPDVDL